MDALVDSFRTYEKGTVTQLPFVCFINLWVLRYPIHGVNSPYSTQVALECNLQSKLSKTLGEE